MLEYRNDASEQLYDETGIVTVVSLEGASDAVVAPDGSISSVEEHRQNISRHPEVGSTSAEDNVSVAAEHVTRTSKVEDSVYDLATSHDSLRTPIEYGENSQNADVVSRSPSANSVVAGNQNVRRATQGDVEPFFKDDLF